MPPRKQPWWHANSGWVVALALAVFNLYQSRSDQLTKGAVMQEIMPQRRDREIDQLNACLQRQIDLIQACRK